MNWCSLKLMQIADMQFAELSMLFSTLLTPFVL